MLSKKHWVTEEYSLLSNYYFKNVKYLDKNMGYKTISKKQENNDIQFK